MSWGIRGIRGGAGGVGDKLQQAERVLGCSGRHVQAELSQPHVNHESMHSTPQPTSFYQCWGAVQRGGHQQAYLRDDGISASNIMTYTWTHMPRTYTCNGRRSPPCSITHTASLCICSPFISVGGMAFCSMH